MLLVGAGLLAGTLDRLRASDKGFDEDHVLVAALAPRLTDLRQNETLGLYDDLLRRVTALPGVRAASLSGWGGQVLGSGFRKADVFFADSASPADAHTSIVTPGHFETMGIPLLRGRTFGNKDDRNAPRIAVVNQTLAHRLFGEVGAALGQRFHFDHEFSASGIEVVGVVGDTKATGLREETPAAIYLPVAQHPEYLRSLEVRAVGDPAALAAAIRRAVREANPNLPVPSVRTLRSQVERSLTQERLLAALSTAFGLAALFLVCLGLYGVISQWAAQRTREIGVRIALGATTGGVRWMVLRQAFALVLAGVALGLPAAMAASRLLKGFLFGLSPTDPAILTAAPLALFAVATAAAYLPARRASRVDPMEALRCE
jgi:predicted permease